MNQIKVSDIQWDCDDAKQKDNLPKEVVIDTNELPDYIWADLEIEIGEYLAEKYGYCNKGYGWDFRNTNCEQKKGEEND